MYKKVFSIFLIALFLCLGVKILFFTEQTQISYVENRDFVTNDDLHPSEVLSGKLQSKLGELLSDQFPDRYFFVKLKNKTEFSFVSSFYRLLKNDRLLNPIGSGYVNEIGTSEILMTSPLLYHEEWAERIKDRIDQVNKLQEDYPEIAVYVYKPTQIHETAFFDEANGIESAGAYYGSLFAGLKVPYDCFEIKELADYPKYFYTTDHHWNNRGSYLGYTQILDLLFAGEKEALVPLEETDKDGLKFYGTYSSQSGYVTKGSEFSVYRFELPEYRMFNIKGEEMTIQNTNTFFYKNVSDEMGYHYNDCYKAADGMTVIDTNCPEKDNILIIGDSYGGPVLPLLAKDFNRITFIYPTNYKALTGEDFNYDRFIHENKVDKILIMYTIENYYLSDEWGPRYLDFDVKREVAD